MEDIRSVATIRVINYTILGFDYFRCEPCKDYQKILSAMASKLKENDVLFNKFTPHVKLTKKQSNLKTRIMHRKSDSYMQLTKCFWKEQNQLLMRKEFC